MLFRFHANKVSKSVCIGELIDGNKASWVSGRPSGCSLEDVVTGTDESKVAHFQLPEMT